MEKRLWEYTEKLREEIGLMGISFGLPLSPIDEVELKSKEDMREGVAGTYFDIFRSIKILDGLERSYMEEVLVHEYAHHIQATMYCYLKSMSWKDAHGDIFKWSYALAQIASKRVNARFAAQVVKDTWGIKIPLVYTLNGYNSDRIKYSESA